MIDPENTELIDEEVSITPEDAALQKEMMDVKIEEWATHMLGKRAEAIEFRANSGVERRWRMSEKLIDFATEEEKQSMMDYASGQAPMRNKGPKRSKVTMNIVRSRCETAEGRFSDVMLPVDDKNWALKVTPNPTMENMLSDPSPAMQNGQPIMVNGTDQQATMADVATDITSRAEKAMDGMEREIDDQLVECDYNGECRKMIASAIRLGTGILKGPNVVKSVKKSWKPETADGVTVHIMNHCEDLTPSTVSVSPWNVYPSADCGDDIAKSSFIWEKDTTVKVRDIIDLTKLPPEAGYNQRQLQLVLDEAPKRTSYSYDSKSDRNKARVDRSAKNGLYEKWEFYGDVAKEDLEMLGCDCVDSKVASACIVFINDRPVKAKLNTLDTGDLPFDFFTWTTVSDEPWGVGIPYIMMWSQRIIDAAWRAMMDNAGDSAGVNIVIGPGLEPENGIWEITGKKIWRPDGSIDLDDVRKAFAQFQVANNQDQFQKIIELVLRFVDLETAMPTIFQGEAQEVPETLGATNIMVDAANTAFRNRAKRFDDRVTKRHLRRYYDFNMQYNPDESIKGDFNVDPRGVSVLYEKDQQGQLLLQVFQLKADPDINRLVDWDKATRQFFATRRLNILKDDKKIAQDQQAQQQGPQQAPPNPNLEVAQVRVQGDMEKAKLVQQSDMAELQFKAQQSELDRQHQMQLKEMDLKLKMMEYSERRNIALDQLKAQLAISSQGMNLQRELSDKPSDSNVSVKIPQVSSPPTEPYGRAPNGQAYER